MNKQDRIEQLLATMEHVYGVFQRQQTEFLDSDEALRDAEREYREIRLRTEVMSGGKNAEQREYIALNDPDVIRAKETYLAMKAARLRLYIAYKVAENNLAYVRDVAALVQVME